MYVLILNSTPGPILAPVCVYRSDSMKILCCCCGDVVCCMMTVADDNDAWRRPNGALFLFTTCLQSVASNIGNQS